MIFRNRKAIAFFNQINMLYGTVTEFCTNQECPVMCAGPRFEYHWQDGVTYKRPTKLSAPRTFSFLLQSRCGAGEGGRGEGEGGGLMRLLGGRVRGLFDELGSGYA